MPGVLLKSSEGDLMPVDTDIIRQSTTINTMLEDLGTGEEGVPETIPVPTVRTKILKLVIAWCDHHKNDPPPPPVDDDDDKDGYERRRATNIPVWDMEFYGKDLSMICELIMAANFLDIDHMMEYGCMTIANMIRGKTTEEMREILGIENDFTKEEEEQIRRENAWCED